MKKGKSFYALFIVCLKKNSVKKEPHVPCGSLFYY